MNIIKAKFGKRDSTTQALPKDGSDNFIEFNTNKIMDREEPLTLEKMYNQQPTSYKKTELTEGSSTKEFEPPSVEEYMTLGTVYDRIKPIDQNSLFGHHTTPNMSNYGEPKEVCSSESPKVESSNSLDERHIEINGIKYESLAEYLKKFDLGDTSAIEINDNPMNTRTEYKQNIETPKNTRKTGKDKEGIVEFFEIDKYISSLNKNSKLPPQSDWDKSKSPHRLIYFKGGQKALDRIAKYNFESTHKYGKRKVTSRPRQSLSSNSLNKKGNNKNNQYASCTRSFFNMNFGSNMSDKDNDSEEATSVSRNSNEGRSKISSSTLYKNTIDSDDMKSNIKYDDLECHIAIREPNFESKDMIMEFILSDQNFLCINNTASSTIIKKEKIEKVYLKRPNICTKDFFEL